MTRNGLWELIGTIYFASSYAAMDDLLKRADRAIEEGYRVRDEAIEQLVQVRRVARALRLAVGRARSARSRYRQSRLEMADRQDAFEECPAGTLSSDQPA
ncbi:hypothetical protein JQ631_24935 [Bradyrhizobium manausense]|uniref:hypothetical protein n=1 Tax=Bradyrhizobium manausense TaxID=989370 RepID=UPI001BAC959C|nr:hypothetical protein [Bradyrhizobium manausense]MBR0792344.1 hypothetical protein [Bradyrhizobium manausense]